MYVATTIADPIINASGKFFCASFNSPLIDVAKIHPSQAKATEITPPIKPSPKDKEEDIFGHAEIKALKEASSKVGSWILDDVSVYVTLEPCFMCAGALLQARVKKIVFAASEPKHGAIGSITNIFELPNINHHPEIIKGINEIEASTLLKQFFKDLREKRKSK